MSFRYETHMHTSQASACSGSTGAEMARAHKAAGYDGIFVTDHFFNGNTCVPRELPWDQRIALFCKGYEDARAEGEKIGLTVFFGFEYGVGGADFLVYNLDKAWLKAHPDIDKVRAKEAFAMMRADGGFIVHAHPFRERDYIDHIRLFPRSVDGVEIINGAHFDCLECNERAATYAKMFDLPITAGSDSHFTNALYGSGIETPTPIEKPTDYLKMMRAGLLTLRPSNGILQ